MATYIHGNAVRKEAPQVANNQRQTDRQMENSRSKLLHMSRGYVAFLTIATIVTLLVCVNYLHLQLEVASQAKTVSQMQQQLADLKEENNAKQDAIMNSVNLEEIGEKAIHDLGMVQATPKQVVFYKNPIGNEVMQYSMIPENGIIAGAIK